MKVDEILREEKWSSEVKTKKRPPENLFAEGNQKEILTWLKSTHKELKSAMGALNFYINRAGHNLSKERKSELEKMKASLRKAYE